MQSVSYFLNRWNGHSSSSRLLLLRLPPMTKSSFLLATTTMMATAVTSYMINVSYLDSTTNNTATKNQEKQFQIEIDFMKKLQSKPYLQAKQQHSAIHHSDDSNSYNSTVPNSLRIITIDLPEVAMNGFTNGSCRLASNYTYPDGIAPPHVVDPPKTVKSRKSNRNPTTATEKNNRATPRPFSTIYKKDASTARAKELMEIEQKAWVQSMFHCCHQHVNIANFSSNNEELGVEILQASMEALNPRNIVKRRRNIAAGIHQQQQNHDEENVDKIKHSSHPKTNDTMLRQHHDSDTTNDVMDEYDAPWNQYAWIAEMNLRISGKTLYFGAPMMAATRWRRWIYGEIYQPSAEQHQQQNCQANNAIWVNLCQFLFGSFGNDSKSQIMVPTTDCSSNLDQLSNSTSSSSSNASNESLSTQIVSSPNTKNSRNNIDYDDNNSNYYHDDDLYNQSKPHAVIANGTTLQMVPHSFKLLQKVCHENNVPLFIMYDPRMKPKWGSNYINDTSNDDLSNVLGDVRRIVKFNIIQQYQHHMIQSIASSSKFSLWAYYKTFQNGRYVGKMESDARWYSKNIISNMEVSKKHSNDMQQMKLKEQSEWNDATNDVSILRRKLIQYGIIREPTILNGANSNDDENDKNTTSLPPTKTTTDGASMVYSKSLIALAKEICHQTTSSTGTGTSPQAIDKKDDEIQP